MNIMQLSACAAAIVAAAASFPASAQDADQATRSRDVISQPILPAPEKGKGDIVVKLGDATRIYFKKPIKRIKIGDELLVKAAPQTDHVVEFSGLAPGRSAITVEDADGKSSSWDIDVLVVSEPHVVKVYQAGHINRQTGERRSDSSSEIGGYVTLSCNEIGCRELEPEIQARFPAGTPR
ncbi:pilus assembly protein N-terminal domain-containing protein [Bradyrhizobium genomosp. III]|uniref:pilus assembly protein N-terminal domain-containing protein n=1 Tax=Bradyrhizobium genomosp. III TaxID=2683271 RepID=UPI0009D9CB6F|nr:pilus assembly protein N-terminal domain-containing protein [Bradyrhizobium sp. CCBAU 15635]